LVRIESRNVETLKDSVRIVGKLRGKEITYTEVTLEMLKDPAFIGIDKLLPFEPSTSDWKCKYCDSLNPKNIYECHTCGASRK